MESTLFQNTRGIFNYNPESLEYPSLSYASVFPKLLFCEFISEFLGYSGIESPAEIVILSELTGRNPANRRNRAQLDPRSTIRAETLCK